MRSSSILSESNNADVLFDTLRLGGQFRGAARIPSAQDAILNTMNPPPAAPKIHLTNTTEYRENYANSVQVRVSLWDFFLSFGTINQTTPDAVAIHNFQGIFLSPQQAKALTNVLAQNIQQYETAFGEIKLEPNPAGPIIQ
jgi:flagellar protein FlaG